MPRPRLDHVRKAQILAAAATVLSERGYANARVADIARAAGTSPAAILYWFDGKDRLLAEALALREQEFHDRYTEQLTGLPTASDRLRLLIAAMLDDYDWGLWLELCVLALRDERAAAERDRMDRRWRSALRAVIRDGQERGEFTREAGKAGRVEKVGTADDAMFLLAALLDGLAPLLTVRAKGVTRERVERTWLSEAARLLGPRFDASPLARPRRFRGRVVG
jgi:AcrR family transcriptional regulator